MNNLEINHVNPAIVASNISKSFKRKGFRRVAAMGLITNLFSKNRADDKQKVLETISFDVKKGEILGIIGKNGSGKSTLLRILAGVYIQDVGSIENDGEIFYLTSMGIGLMGKLTMKENIFLVGAIMGLDQKKIGSILDEIVAFSELGDFLYTKIQQFSTGMIGRLGFSISVFCMKNKKSEILLLDEVFGSGYDLAFEQQAINKMEELIRSGATVIMVSHDLDMMEKYCNRVIWLDKGKIKNEGNPKEIISLYKNN